MTDANFDQIPQGIFPEISEDKLRIVAAVLSQTILEEDGLNAMKDVYERTVRALDLISGGRGLRKDLGTPVHVPATDDNSMSGSQKNSNANQPQTNRDRWCPEGLRLGCVEELKEKLLLNRGWQLLWGRFATMNRVSIWDEASPALIKGSTVWPRLGLMR